MLARRRSDWAVGMEGPYVVLVVGHVAFVSCVAPRGAGTNLNDSDAAA